MEMVVYYDIIGTMNNDPYEIYIGEWKDDKRHGHGILLIYIKENGNFIMEENMMANGIMMLQKEKVDFLIIIRNFYHY